MSCSFLSPFFSRSSSLLFFLSFLSDLFIILFFPFLPLSSVIFPSFSPSNAQWAFASTNRYLIPTCANYELRAGVLRWISSGYQGIVDGHCPASHYTPNSYLLEHASLTNLGILTLRYQQVGFFSILLKWSSENSIAFYWPIAYNLMIINVLTMQSSFQLKSSGYSLQLFLFQ